MNYLGMRAVNSTVYVFVTTHAQTGAAVAPSSALEAADFLLYKNGSGTQRSSTSGWTITSPFDSITGLHLLSIDLSDNTDAGFYAAGSNYSLILSPDETIDGLATVRVVATFDIGVQAANVTQVGGTSQTAGDLVALINTIDDFLDTEVAAIKAKTDNLPTDPADASDIASSFSTVNTKLDTIDDFLDTEVAAIKAKTDLIPADPASTTNITAGTITTVTNLTNAPTAGDLTATMKSSVLTQVEAGLATDTYAEPGQGVPASTTSLAAKIGYLYKAWRNKTDQTSTEYSLYADDAATVDQKATVSDNGTTFSKTEIASGP